jgi:hypothetical protein
VINRRGDRFFLSIASWWGKEVLSHPEEHMRDIRPRFHPLFQASWIPVLVAVVLLACSKNPTGSGHPFEGRWRGTWNDGPYSASFGIDVDAAGGAEATGNRMGYSVSSFSVIEELKAPDLFVDRDGRVTGTGTWYATITGYGVLTISGQMTGILYRSTNTGQGGLIIQVPDGPRFAFTWSVTRR